MTLEEFVIYVEGHYDEVINNIYVIFCMHYNTVYYEHNGMYVRVDSDGDFWYHNKDGKGHNINGPYKGYNFNLLYPDFRIDGEYMTKEEWEMARIPYIELEKIYGGEEL